MNDHYGESGAPAELMTHFGLDAASIAAQVKQFCDTTPRYHQGF
jgi:transketolase C-terminal domain/subunit